MRTQKIIRRILAVLLSAVMVLGSAPVSAMGEVSAGMDETPGLEEVTEGTENPGTEDSEFLTETELEAPEVNTTTGGALRLGIPLSDYQINEDAYSWSSGEQTVSLNGSDTLTILNAPPVDAKVKIEVASVSGSSITISGQASTTYNNVWIDVKRDVDLTLDNLMIVAPDTFMGLVEGNIMNLKSFPALSWKSTGGTATLTISGECSLTGSMFSAGLQVIGSQKLTITGNGGGDDSLNAQGGSYTIPEENKNQVVGSGINILNTTSDIAKLTVKEITVNATGGADNGTFGTGGNGLSVTTGDLEIIDATVTAVSGTDSNPTITMSAILVGSSTGGGEITITNSNVTAIGANNASSDGDAGMSASKKITINSGTVVSKAGNSTSAKGGAAITVAELQILGGTVTATGGKSVNSEGGKAIYIWPGALQTSDGVLTAIGGKSDNNNGGVAIYTGTLQLSGGTITAQGGNGKGYGGHGFFVASGTATVESGSNLTAVGGNGETGGGVGLRAYGYTGVGNTVTIADSAGDIYIRGGQGAIEQRASIMGSAVYIRTGNVGSILKEAAASGFHIKNLAAGDDVYRISVSTNPAAEVTIHCLVGGDTPSEYTYRSKADQNGTAYLWLPAGVRVLKADNYLDTSVTVATDNTSTAVMKVSPVISVPTAQAGEEYIDVTDVTSGAQLKLYTSKGDFVSSTYKDMGNGTYRFENILPSPLLYYVIQSIEGIDSANTPFLNTSFRVPVATGGEGYVEVTNVSSAATIRLYKVLNGTTTLISDEPVSTGDGTYRFNNIIPERAQYYVTQYANTLESTNSTFVSVSLPTPSITGGNKQVMVSKVYPGATLTLYNFEGIVLKQEDNVTTDTYQFNEVTPGAGYYVQQTINGVVSLISNYVRVYSTAPKFVGGSQSVTVNQYPSITDLRDQLYVSDLDVAQTLTWTVISEPSNGTLTGFPVTASTNEAGGISATTGSTDIRIPSAVGYRPNTGFTGEDSFTIEVSDGTATDTRVIHVGVNLTAGQEITVNNSDELEAAINNPAVGTINLKAGTVYQISGAEINRSMTINGNGAVIEAVAGVGRSFDNQTIYHLGMPDGNGNRRYRGNLFWYVKEGGSLTVKDLTLKNTAISENAQGLTGIFAAILLSDASNLSLSEVSFENFWFKNSKLAQQNNLYTAQGLYSSYSDMSYGVYADYNFTGNINVSSSIFGSTNAFRDAVHIYNGNSVSVDRSTFVGTAYPERLRESDSFEYGIYLYGGNCFVTNNNIRGYDSWKITGYASGGIALIPYKNVNAFIENNTIEENNKGLDFTGGWKALNPAPRVTINDIELETGEDGFLIGEGLKASNRISGSLTSNIYIKLDQDDDDNAFVYYSPFLSVDGTNKTKPRLNFSQTADAVQLIASATTIEVQKSEDEGQSWTTASLEEALNNSATSAQVQLEENKSYVFRVKMTHNNNQTPNSTVTGYSDAVNYGTLSNDAGIESILSKSITEGVGAGTSLEPRALSIDVEHSVTTVALSDIVKSDTGAVVTFYGTDSSFHTPASGSVALVSGGNTIVYLKITARDASTIKYYSVTIKRGAAPVTPDPVTPTPDPVTPTPDPVTPTPDPVTPAPNPGSGTSVIPAPGNAEKVEQITVDVKQGDTNNTVAQISITRTTHSDGTKSDAVTYQQQKAKETIDKLKEKGEDVARILIPAPSTEVTKTQVTVPSASLNTLSEGQVSLQIDTEAAKIDIPKTSLNQANEKLKEDLFFKLVPIKEAEEKREVTQRAVIEVGVISNNQNTNVSALGNPMTIETNMPSSDVDITLPLSGISIPTDTSEREAFLSQLAVYIEHSDGEKELVKGEIVEYRSGVLGIRFHITKFSTFTIVKLEKSSDCSVTKVIVPAKATLKGSKIAAAVENATKSLTVKVSVSDKASWKLYLDKALSRELKNNKLALKVGTNTAYLKVTAEDGKTTRIYTVTITRQELPKQLIIIANKYDFADAFVGGVPALQSGGEVITAGIAPEDAKKLVDYIKKNYTKQDKIYILGLEKAVNKDVEKLLKKEGYTDVIRIGGKDKYETAKKTAGIVKLSEKVRVVLVNGTVKPEDAESIQKICAEKGYPILLVQKNNLTDSTLEALKVIKPVRVYILGNQATISKTVADQVSQALKLKSSSVIRIKSGKEIK